MVKGLARMAEIADPAQPTWTIVLPDEAATEALARIVAEELAPGDLLTLSGGLGAGKTTFGRALVRILVGNASLEVPSPTFTLMQVYEGLRSSVVHADFYRLGGAPELVELGWEETTDGAIALAEWPERVADGLKADRLDIALEIEPRAGTQGRVATLTGFGEFGPRIERLRAFKAVAEQSGWTGAERVRIQGDASTRAYERLVKPGGETSILMISPPRPDGPPVRRGKPYSAIAKLAESVHAFVAVDRGLRALGLSAPRIFGGRPRCGPPDRRGSRRGAIRRRLGADPGALWGSDAPPRRHALDRAAAGPAGRGGARARASRLRPRSSPHRGGTACRLVCPPHHRPPALRVGARRVHQSVVGNADRRSRRTAHLDAARLPLAEPHLACGTSRASQRVGLIDFQDAVLGHPAYDVASLLQDARVTVPAELELKLISLYARERRLSDEAFDVAEFAGAYAILGAQRATKILGIFARLDKRDGKPQYLRHLPRIETYLSRNLAHPVLSRLRGWYEAHLPRIDPLA